MAVFLSPPTPPETILVHMNRNPVDAYGEVFLRLPFFRALRAWAPHSHIAIIPGIGGETFWEELIQPIAKHLVNEIIRTEIPDPAVRRFDWVFDLEGDARTSLRLRKLATANFHTVAWRGFLNFPHLPRYHGKHITRRYLGALKQAIGRPLPDFWPYPFPQEYRDAAEILLPAGRTYVGFAPGAGVQNTGKCWPIERYAEVAARQSQAGRTPVIFLSHSEKDWDKHFTAVPDAIFPLKENSRIGTGVSSDPVLTAAIAEKLSAAVSNCNGTGHMLAFGGAPIITLFGPSSPKKFSPFARDSIHLKPPNPKSHNIVEIDVPAVCMALNELLKRAKPLRN